MNSSIVVRKPRWSNSLLPLVCGIANAGGGTLMLTAIKNKSMGIRKVHKYMETIPGSVQSSLGISCIVDPIMEGMMLCLEVQIPAAEEPVDHNGTYYLYRNHRNETVSESEVVASINSEENVETFAKTGAGDDNASDTSDSGKTSAPASAPSSDKKARSSEGKPHARNTNFVERSVAAANDVYLTVTDEYILKILRTNGRATAGKMATALGVSESTVRRSFKRLKDEGFIERIGSKKAGYWKLLK